MRQPDPDLVVEQGDSADAWVWSNESQDPGLTVQESFGSRRALSVAMLVLELWSSWREFDGASERPGLSIRDLSERGMNRQMCAVGSGLVCSVWGRS